MDVHYRCIVRLTALIRGKHLKTATMRELMFIFLSEDTQVAALLPASCF